MKTLGRDASFDLWNAYWDSMKKEWFKVEVLQDYSGEDTGPSLDAWKNGDKWQSIRLIKEEDYSEWIKDCKKKRDEGVKLTRVHIVKEPLSDYFQWELEHYKLINIPRCGEDVFTVSDENVFDLPLPKGDIMFFDDDKIVVNEYNSEGKMIKATFYDEKDKLDKFLELREKLRARMEPVKFF